MFMHGHEVYNMYKRDVYTWLWNIQEQCDTWVPYTEHFNPYNVATHVASL